MTRLFAFVAALLLCGCAQAPRDVTFHADGYPDKLSAWGLFDVGADRLAPRARMITYELATPLFSDYAQKWRTVWLPEGARAHYDPDRWFDFPVGTIVTKTFYYTTAAADPQTSGEVVKMTPATYQSGARGLDLAHVRLLETRLLVKRSGGWVAIPYVWDADGRDATLARTGTAIPLTLTDGAARTRFTYTVPNQNQCAGCHVQDYRTRRLQPIGLKARHLAPASFRRLSAAYLADAPAAPPQTREAARRYLDINCSHCHNAAGAARTSGLWLDAATTDARLRGVCKPPVAAGRGTGDRSFDVVPGHPEASILTYRMESIDPAEMMPELGRALTHREGVALVARAIASMKGACVADDGTR